MKNPGKINFALAEISVMYKSGVGEYYAHAQVNSGDAPKCTAERNGIKEMLKNLASKFNEWRRGSYERATYIQVGE
ncbi:MAG: hypothetical protein FWB91_05060 [Defluviitaleaceae bacterium]|nr:hypothetical protein [Defluviitaleaceae bacterium]